MTNTGTHPPPHLDPDLVDNVARGSCVLFLGADYPLASPGAPTRAQLAEALASRYPDVVTPGKSFADAAQQFLNRRNNDRNTLIRFLHERVSPVPAWTPTEVHKAIVNLGLDAVVTAWYDDLMERAYEQAGKRVAKVVSGVDSAYAGGGEDVILVKLYGDLAQPTELVIAKNDMLRVEGNLSQRLEDVRPFVRLRPILFLGWNPADESLLRLYLTATAALGEHKRRNFIVWPQPQQENVDDWAAQNVVIVDEDPLTFLQTLHQAVLSKGRPAELGVEAKPQQVVGKLPYKSLDYFDPTDQDIFCGREVEAPVVFRMALSYPLLTLFGQSGVGKTSLLRAGVIPRLEAEKYRYAYVRILGDPLLAIRQEVCRALGIEDRSRARAGKRLLDFFREVLGEQDKLVVIVDQFEELFTRAVSRETRREFWRELSACLGLENPELHFVLSLREDFLARLDEARKPLDDGTPAPVSGILRYSYGLDPLTVDTASLAIIEPAERANCEVDQLLADVLLGRADMPGSLRCGQDIVEGQAPAEEDGRAWSLVEVDGKVPPPSLQIVMTQLYLRALAAAGQAPPPEQPDPARPWQPPALQLTAAGYGATGGARRILAEYITQALDRLGTEKYPGDRRLAEAVLKAMVTAQETKAALDEPELVEELAQTGTAFDEGADVETLRTTRASLVNLRLLRSFQVGERALVELAHDHMAKEIRTWISDEEMAGKAVRELIRREVDSWQRHGLLVAPEALRLVHEQRDALRKLKPVEVELVFRSALKAGYEVSYWFEQARSAGVAVDALAREGLGSASFRTRKAAVSALAELGELYVDDIVGCLADEYPQVRAAAIAALERLQPDGAWRRHLKFECYVPAGEFIMGDNEKESGYSDKKATAHPVYVDAFYIGKYPVTNAEYARFMADLGRGFEMLAGKEQHPVVSISWYDAKDYAVWAEMRLLTEAQWEKAASWEAPAVDKEIGNPSGGTSRQGLVQRVFGQPKPGGKKRVYPWVGTFDKDKCNTSESRIGDTTPVGTYSPAGDSPCGAADMAGNVWEWCSSKYEDYPYDADDGRENLTDYAQRVQRGGSFDNVASNARCAARDWYDPFNRIVLYGFRVCWASPSASDL